MSFTRTNPYKQYKTTEVESLSQGKLIIILYDGAIRFLEDAMEASSDFKRYDEVNNKLLKVQDIVSELMVSLNMDEGGEVAKNLLSIYIYLKNTLIQANIDKNRKKMEEVHKHLVLLKDSWKEISDKEAPKSNTQEKSRQEKPEGGISFTG